MMITLIIRMITLILMMIMTGEEPRHEQAHEEAPGNGQLGILSTDMVAVVLQVW